MRSCSFSLPRRTVSRLAAPHLPLSSCFVDHSSFCSCFNGVFCARDLGGGGVVCCAREWEQRKRAESRGRSGSRWLGVVEFGLVGVGWERKWAEIEKESRDWEPHTFGKWFTKIFSVNRFLILWRIFRSTVKSFLLILFYNKTNTCKWWKRFTKNILRKNKQNLTYIFFYTKHQTVYKNISIETAGVKGIIINIYYLFIQVIII